MMVRSIAILLLLSALGDAVANWSQLPVPGPAVGLGLLVGIFVIRGAPDQGLAKLFDAVSPFFPLFFVPAAAGIVANLELFAHAWVHVLAAVVLGTVATIAVTGIVAQLLLRMIGEARIA
jgi:holin-like protein